MGAELAFCCKFHGTRFKENGTIRFGLMVVMAANLGLWFQSLVYEATERDKHGKEETMQCSNESDHSLNLTFQACVHKTTSAYHVMKTMIHYLYPFAIEFSLLVGEFLVSKFVSSSQRRAGGPEVIPSTGIDVSLSRHAETPGDDRVTAPQIQTPDDDSVNISQRQRSVDDELNQPGPLNRSGNRIIQLGPLLSGLIIAIGLSSSFIYISLAFTDSFADGRNETEITTIDGVNWGEVYEIYSMINYILISALLIVGYACGYGLEIQEKKLHGLDWLVLISAFGPFMRELMCITAVAASYTALVGLPVAFPAILICSRLANWIQFILQSPFIFLSERWRLTDEQRNHPRYLCREKILKATIFCLAAANLTNWISDSIIITNSFSIKKESLDTIFEGGHWKIVEHISLPLLIFYRFNSFLLFTRAYIGE